MKKLTIIGGIDKSKNTEKIENLELFLGEMYSIVGNTGAGKSRLIKDIEQLSNGNTITKRKIFIDDEMICENDNLIAHLSQNMRFVLDISVKEFLNLHAKCKNKEIDIQTILNSANKITAEPVFENDTLNSLSGGQTRALMIADIAHVCDSPVVLIDEIENAGIDKENALNLLLSENKLVLAVTHDPHTALMANKRIIMKNGAMDSVLIKTTEENELYIKLCKDYSDQKEYQKLLRLGENLSCKK